jgi:hypothetical protein
MNIWIAAALMSGENYLGQLADRVVISKGIHSRIHKVETKIQNMVIYG